MKNSTTLNKKNAVICVNPHDRQSYILDFYKKYNFTPILIYSKAKDAIGDMSDGVSTYIGKTKSRNKNLVFFTDKGNDFDKIVKELKEKYNVLAVCPGWDVSLEYVDKLAQALGVNGNDPKTITLRKDKGWVAKQLLKNKIRTPITMEFSPNNSIDTNLNKISKTFKSFPIVLKPYEGLGSKGVQIINNKIDLKKALHECVYFQKIHPSMGSKFLVQEYISGEEGFVNFYSFNGKHLVTDAWMYNKRLVNGHSLDFECVLTMKMSPALNNAISYCKKVLDAIGYKWGPTHIEVKYDNKGVCLIEVNMRVMGSHCLPKQPVFFDYSTPELAFLSLSNSPLLAKYIGKDAYDKSKKLCQAIYCINAPYDFVVKKINVERCIKHLPTFSSFISNVKVNEKVKKTVNMIDTIGEIGLVGSERQVKKDLKELHKIWENNFADWYGIK